MTDCNISMFILYTLSREKSLQLNSVFQKKIAQSLCTVILQLYVTESRSFQQNVQKEIVYTTKAVERSVSEYDN